MTNEDRKDLIAGLDIIGPAVSKAIGDGLRVGLQDLAAAIRQDRERPRSEVLWKGIPLPLATALRAVIDGLEPTPGHRLDSAFKIMRVYALPKD